MSNPLEAVAQGVTDYLRAFPPVADIPVNSAMDGDGYRSSQMPSLTVDAPTISAMETGLGSFRDSVSLTVKVLPASHADTAGLIRLTDQTLAALRDGGFNATGCALATLSPDGPNPIPVYVITLTMATITER